MSSPFKSHFWSTCRLCFRRCRITVWLLLLALLGTLIYINQIGLPTFVKRPLLDKLRAGGLDLQFSRMRLRWYQGIVADNVRFGQANEPLSPQLTVEEVQVRLNGAALRQFQLQVDGLVLRQGRLVWPLAGNSRAPSRLSLENVHCELRLLPGDLWALDNFTAAFSGAKIKLSGMVTNASAVRDWNFWRAERLAPPGAWQTRLRQFADTLEVIHFSEPPELEFDFRGDARSLRSFRLRMLAVAPGADTPWGAVARGRLSVLLLPAASNGVSSARLNLEVAAAQTRWAVITNLHADVRLSAQGGAAGVINGELGLSARQASTGWGQGSNVQLTARWVHSLTNPIPLSGQTQIEAEQARTEWASARWARLTARFAAPPATSLRPCDASWGWWTNLHPYRLDWQCALAGAQSRGLAADEAIAIGGWHAPQLTITNLHARLCGGEADVRAGLDVASRALDLRLASDLDVRQLSPVLPESIGRSLAQLDWKKPPKVSGELSLTLPPWTNRPPDWQGELRRTLSLSGEFTLAHGGVYRQLSVDSLHSHFLYSNFCWRLPDLTATRPEGRLAAAHTADDRTKDFYWRISSTIGPAILRPLLEAGKQEAFDLLKFKQPPAVEAEVWGRYQEPGRTAAQGKIALTNFTFRGETVDRLQTAFHYTNGLLECFAPRFQRGEEGASADGLAADFNAQLIYLTNGLSTIDPYFVARAIGPQILRAIEAYRYLKPPTARVHGVIPMRGEDRANLHFDLDGGPFHWWKFNLPRVAGHVHWAGKSLTLTNVQADFYHGQATGWATFDFRPPVGDDFQFSATATNALLQALMADLSTTSNHLEGTLGGTLTVTKANTESWRTVFGYGDLTLRDGLVWEIPLFGKFTPVLNEVSPGLGNSRASAAACVFAITNGVIRSDNLDIRSPLVRLQYRGTVDLEGRLNARVAADPLRGMWGVGPIFSTVLWPVTRVFEYKVTGALDDPKTEPLYFLPRLVLFPFHPLRTLKGLMPEDSASVRTNAPPAEAPFSDLP